MNIHEFEKEIAHSFAESALLTRALTHSSIGADNNERLEFLGDAVLEFLASEYLYARHANLSEGEMTRVRASSVCEGALFSAARDMRLGEFINLSKGEENSGGRRKPSILADAFEALLAAVYLDGGLDAARAFFHKYVAGLIERAVHGDNKDAKTRLQEILQKDGAVKIEYAVLGESGLDHEKRFLCAVIVDGRELGRGSGLSKKEAEQHAAAAAIEGAGQRT